MRLPATTTLRVLVAVLVVAVVAAVTTVVVVTRADDDPFADYCAEVRAQQKPITEAAALGASQALLEALPSFERLSAVAPDDLLDEWAVVVQRITALRDALDAAGVDAATYDSKNPPADLTDADRTRLIAAASGLVTLSMNDALRGVEQQARDVCKTPLSL